MNKPSCEKFKKDYINKRFIDIKINDFEKKIINKLGIKILNKLYTEYEYHKIEMIIYSYYEVDEEGNIKINDRLLKKGINKKEYEEILNKFSSISSYYNL